MRNPYDVLGISAAADPQSIRRAYKKLAVAFHPDRNHSPEAAERFKEVAEAYAVLTSDQARQRYARARRREHAAREEHRRQTETARRQSAAKSETVEAAERAFREYARQVQQRRQRTARGGPDVVRKLSTDWWGDRIGPALAILLIAVYLWRSAWGLSLQPWFPIKGFATYPLTSPIWITLSLGMLMVVRPRWFRIPMVMEELRVVRLYGWMMLVVPPLVSGDLLSLLPA